MSSVARRISGISRLLYIGQQGQKFDRWHTNKVPTVPKMQARKQDNAQPLGEYQANFGKANTCNFYFKPGPSCSKAGFFQRIVLSNV